MAVTYESIEKTKNLKTLLGYNWKRVSSTWYIN